MKLVQFYDRQDLTKSLQVGIVLEDQTIQSIPSVNQARELIEKAMSASTLQQLAEGGKLFYQDQIQFLPSISNPEKIICVGLNYLDHVLESNMQVPKVPVLFPKFNNCLVGHNAEVVIPAEVEQCDYEVELAVIIGKKASRIAVDTAMDYVYGYTVLNDVSARDIQLNEGQWTRGKTIDGFAPVGPWIVTADEIGNPGNLTISLSLNGERMQHSNTKELIFNIPYLIAFLSQTMTLQPGDIISTGTPPGVGMGKSPQVWLKRGDVVEATVEGIGTLRNTFY